MINIENQWHDRDVRPEEDKDIVVRDIEGTEYDNHYWNGHCYYSYVEWDDGTCDGYPSDIDIVIWRYK